MNKVLKSEKMCKTLKTEIPKKYFFNKNEIILLFSQ